MGILGSLFGVSDEASTDFGSRLALAGQVLMAMDQGQVANIGPSVAALNERRRKIADEMQSKKWLQNQAAMMADKNPQLAQFLENAPPEVGASLISKYLETLPEFRAPDWKTFESQGDIYRYNPLDPTSKPELFFDGPDDPFKQLLKSVMPPTLGASAPSAAPSVPAAGMPAPGVPEMPAPGGAPAANLPPQMKMLAETFGLPDATEEEVRAIAQAGMVGGADQARATADAFRQRREGEKKLGFDMNKETVSNAFKLQDDYWRVGQNYQKIIDTATEIAQLPDDPNAYERLVTLYKFMRSLDPMGAVRESDAALAQSAAGPFQQLEQLMQKYSGASGGEIPMGAAQEMKRLILEIGETTAKADYKARRKVLARAKAIGIPEDKAEQMIFGNLNELEDMSGYKPRFEPPARATDQQLKTEPGAPKNLTPGDFQDLDPAIMQDNVQYPGDDGMVYMKRNGKIFVLDPRQPGAQFKEFTP